MVKIIPASQQLSTRERFANAFAGAGRGANEALSHYLNKEDQIRSSEAQNASKQNELSQKNAHDINLQERKFSHEMDIMNQKNQMENQERMNKLSGENQENLAPFYAGLDTIKQMKAIKNKGHVGVGSSLTGLFSEDVRKDRAQYSQLGKSLISLASSIPIRNQAEFNTLAEDLFDPSLSQSAMDGVLDAMEQIIKQNMRQYQSGQEMQEPLQQQSAKQKTTPLEDIWK